MWYVEFQHPNEKEWRKALVVEKGDKRSYTVEISDSGVYRLNRAHFRKSQEPPPTIQQDQEVPVDKLIVKPTSTPTTSPTSLPTLASTVTPDVEIGKTLSTAANTLPNS